jgi:tripartite-type tricarboxylate transporter receptor subunit TctC
MPSRWMPSHRRFLTNLGAAATAVAAITAFLAMPARADNGWPQRPVVLVVPYSAGGPTDVVARMLAVPMGKTLGQPVVVENTVGAGGTLAPARIARSKPDGYTVLIHHMGMATAPSLYRKLPYDPLSDFDYVGQVIDVPMTLLSRKDFPANSLPELVDYVKKNADKVTMAHAGVGAVSQLCALLFMDRIGVKLTQVPYKGAGPALADVMGSQVDLVCDQTTQTAPVIKDGQRVKVFGVTVPNRLATLPDIPTLDEQGVKGFDVKVWHGIYLAKGTPAPIRDKINAALRTALQDESVKQRLNELNAEIVSTDKMTPESLQGFLAEETKRWSGIFKAAGVQAV